VELIGKGKNQKSMRDGTVESQEYAVEDADITTSSNIICARVEDRI
jgi:hypothetical protein